MAEFINYIIDSPIQPVKTNVLWVKKGVLHYYNKKWIPIAGGGSGNITYPIIDGEGNYSAVLAYSDNKALNISSVALGYNAISRNFAEASFGKYNLSHKSDDPSIATLFSVGNGSKEERKNAFEVKEDGEIYIGKRTESLQTILYNLENYFLNDKYDILEQQLSDLDAYSRSNIEALKELIKANKLDLQNYKEYVEDDFLKMSTSITQTAEEIRLEASKIEERLNGRITEAESSFSVTAEEIRAEVSRVETDLDGKITKSNSLISQTADEIRTEVSRVELDINGSIREANSRITQTAEEIKSEVYDIQTTLDGKINENSSKIEQTSEEIKSSVKLEQFNALTGAVDQGFTEVKQSVEGIITTIGDRTGKTTSITEDIEGVTVSLGTVEADIESLKKQSDGAIDTHFGTVTPTLDNEPAVNWDTEELKKEHTGDLYYNNTTGEAFRWSYDPETETYLWVELTDSALTEALGKISKLEEAIDGKVTIFYNEPSNYKEGDLWFVHVDYPSYHFIEGQLLTAIAASDIFNASHWEDKTNFASHAEVTESVTQLNNYIDGAFSDNILTVAEIKQIKEAKKNFESLFSEVKESYSYLVISAAATDSDKTALTEAYNNLTHETNGSYTLLIATIDALIALDKEEGDDVLDIEVVEGLLAEYESAYKLFSKDLTAYYAASAKLTEGIQNYLSSASDYINDVMSDGVLSPIEKEQLLNIWRQIAEEFTANRGIAYNYKLLSINDTEEYVKRIDIYPEDSPYHSIYESYENAYDVVKNIFTAVNEEGKNIWGFDDLSVSTTTPEDLTTVYISESLDAYYKSLSPFAEMIAEITIAITDAHEAAKEYVSRLANHLDPKDNISVIGNGVILSTVIGVKSSTDDTFVSAINASNTNTDDLKLIDTTHGRVVYAGGIPSTNNWNDSTTVIYEDGHVKFKSGEISDSVSIGETRQAILNKANTLQESLDVGGNTVIDGGLVLSTLLGVVDTEGNLKSVLNASDISKDTVTGHGRIVFAGGIQNPEDWTTAKTLIYEDGYVHFKWGEIDDAVEIGNALVTAISSGNIDLFSYPETVNGVTTLVPLFQVTKDETGKIIAVHSVYDFYANKDLTTLGETSSGGIGEYNPVAGTVTGIIINTTPYYPNEAGIIDLTDAFEAIGGGGIDVTQLEAYLTSNNYINSVNGIISMLGYTPANNDSLADYLPLSGGKTITGTVTFSASAPAIKFYRASGIPYIRFGASASSEYGELGVTSAGNLVFWSLVSTNSAYNNWYTLYHTGNFNPSDYLLKSGGELTGKLTTTQRISMKGTIFEMTKNDGTGGIMLWNGESSGDGVRNLMIYDGSAWRKTIHSGNIGSQTVNAAFELKNYGGRVANANVGTFGDGVLRTYLSSASMTSNKPPFDGTIMHFAWDNTGGYDHQLFVANNSVIASADERMAWRGQNSGTWGEWKIVAFKDSTVAAANKLATARGLWGNNFDGTSAINGYIFMNSGGEGIYISDAAIHWHDSSNQFTKRIFNFTSGGNVGIDVASPTYKLDVNGTTRSVGGFKSTSISIECDSNGNTSGYGGEINRLGGGQLWIQGREGGLQLGNADSISNFNGAVSMSSTLSVGGNISPKTNNDLHIGAYASASFGFIHANVHSSGAAANNLWLVAGSSTDATGIQFARNNNGTSTGKIGTWDATGLYPATDNAYTLGKSSHQWSTVYAVNAIFSGALSVGGDITIRKDAYGGSGNVVYNNLSFLGSVNGRGGLIRCGINDVYSNFSSLEFGSYVNPTMMLINSSGNVLIGTTNDSGEKLQIHTSAWDGGLAINRTVSGGGASIAIYSNGTKIGCFGIDGSKWFEIANTSDTRFWVDTATGKTTIGQTSLQTSYMLYANGNSYINGTLGVTGAVTMSSTLTVSQKLQCNKPIFGYMYGSNNNAAAFIFDKPGSNYTGIGSDGTSNTIRLSACNGDGGWVDYAQKWKFYGDIIVTGDVASA